jgi:hypothetical protein
MRRGALAERFDAIHPIAYGYSKGLLWGSPFIPDLVLNERARAERSCGGVASRLL